MGSRRGKVNFTANNLRDDIKQVLNDLGSSGQAVLHMLEDSNKWKKEKFWRPYYHLAKVALTHFGLINWKMILRFIRQKMKIATAASVFHKLCACKDPKIKIKAIKRFNGALARILDIPWDRWLPDKVIAENFQKPCNVVTLPMMVRSQGESKAVVLQEDSGEEERGKRRKRKKEEAKKEQAR